MTLSTATENNKKKDDYIPQRLLITGGAGFIASHVVIAMVKKYPDVKVFVLDKLDYCASLKNLEEIYHHPNFKFIKGDITSLELVSYVLENECVDTILHFAAQTHVDNSFGNSLAFTNSNVKGTHVMLEASKRLKPQIRRFIHVSTDEVYGESILEDKPFLEGSVLEPTNPYAATKAAAEFLAKACYRSFNLPVIITRGNNVYGPHQYPEKLIPKFINQMMRDMPLTVHGTGATRRNYLYVSDVASAFETILCKGKAGQVINIGGRLEFSVKQLALKILKLFHREHDEEKWIKYTDDRDFNDQRYDICSEKLRLLGWQEKVSFLDGLEVTKDWYLTHQGHWGDIERALVAHPRIMGDSKTHDLKPINSPRKSKRIKLVDDTQAEEQALNQIGHSKENSNSQKQIPPII
mmetsp:Transcript_8997/g.11289  ORF Transcript_8997/g.11289 Transcript_8997/m.11289 type:complete len:408 (-) Transcript_8997:6-1229(-)